MAEMRDVYIVTCVHPFGCFSHSLETGFVCLCLRVHSSWSDINSCLMFYALLSESDDTAADSPLSQQPLISIAVSFNLTSLVVFP